MTDIPYADIFIPVFLIWTGVVVFVTYWVSRWWPTRKRGLTSREFEAIEQSRQQYLRPTDIHIIKRRGSLNSDLRRTI